MIHHARPSQCAAPRSPSRQRAPLIEALESRQLLAVTVPFAKINFQPATAQVPAGYLVDSGAPYASRGNGLAYGWNAPNTNNTRERFRVSDQRYDTLIHMQVGGNFAWEIAVPNGRYLVRLAAGDPSYINSVYRINLEGALAINTTPTTTNRSITVTRSATVADGKLTISNASSAVNNKIDFVDISRIVDAPASPANFAAAAITPTQINLSWTSASGSPDGFLVDRSTDNLNFTQIANLPAAATTTYSDSAVTDGSTYTYRVRAYNPAGTSPNATAAATTPLAAPTALTVHSFPNVARLDLAWSNNSTAATGFVIEQSQAGGNFVELARVPVNTTTYTQVKLAADTDYTYRVRAYNAAGQSAPATAAAITTPFQVFQTLYYLNQPDLTSFGIQKMHIAANEFFWKWNAGGGYDYNTPNEVGTRRVADAAAAKNQVLVMDIEHWPTDIRSAPAADVQSSIQKLSQIIDWVRNEQPELKIGVYSMMPLRDYWTPVNYLQALDNPNSPWWQANLPKFTEKFRQWQAANDFLKPLADKMDYLFPSLYTFYEDRPGWVYYAKGNLAEAQRYGKPVMPFLWMDYHDGTPLTGQQIPGDYWKLQLDTVRQHADGVVMWGGFQYRAGQTTIQRQWDDSAGWWQATLEFLTTP